MAEIFTNKGDLILVDDEDFARLNMYLWRIDGDGYAIRKSPHPLRPGKYTNMLMHREILGLAFGDPRQGDHRFGKKLDNRKSELRICTPQENLRNVGLRKDNTSGFKGVTWNSKLSKWHARIKVDGRYKHLGFFEVAEFAHQIYCQAAKKYHGEFANFG